MAKARITKKELAEKMGVSVSSLYYKRKRDLIDQEVKAQIEAVLTDNPAYGHKRIALALKLNKKRILRVMKKYGIKPYRRRAKRLVKKKDLGKPAAKFENLIEGITPTRPHQVWVSDFTYIKYQNRFLYLSTIMDLYSRYIVGFNISRFHNKELVIGALENALTDFHLPKYLHSDQGSEYDSQAYTGICGRLNILVSMSRKASPWENPFQESFYSQFKVELGDTSRFYDIQELVVEIVRLVWYYNTRRIHGQLKSSPIKLLESRYKKQGT